MDKKWSGIWWIYSAEEQNNHKVHGTLAFTEEGDMELALTPSPAEPSLKCIGRQSYTIWGEDRYGIKITLFNVYAKRYTSGGGVETLLVNYTIIGAHIPSFETPFFKKAAVKYPNLKEFLFVQQVKMSMGAKFTAFKLEAPPISEIRIPIEEGIEWKLYGDCQWSITHQYEEVKIKQDTYFIVEGKKHASVSFFLQNIGEFSDFLSIALQGKQRPSEINFYIEPEDPQKLEFYYCADKSSRCRSRLIGNSVPVERLQDIIKNWHINYTQILPIYNYLERSSFDNHGVVGIPEFLLVEFAVEGYFKRFHNKLKTNSIDRRKCEDELRALIEYYSKVEIIRNLNLNIETVIATRDAYTHLFPEQERKGIELQSSYEIWVTIEKLRILLLCCLLDIMGFTMDEIDTNFKTAPILLPEQYNNKFLFE